MAKAPAVQFYTGDFLTGTALMSNAEVGLYIRLLCLQAEHGSVPDDVERIVQVYGPTSRSIWPVVRRKFVAGSEDGTLINERMSEVVAKRDEFRQRQSERGKVSALRRINHGSTTVQPRFNQEHGSTTVEPVGDGDRDTTQKGKERASEKPELTWPAFAGEKVKAKWAEFIAYRIAEKKQRYKSVTTEQRALDLVARYFTNGPDFVAGLDHTMARTWAFPVDPSEHKYPHMAKAPDKPVELNSNGKVPSYKPWLV